MRLAENPVFDILELFPKLQKLFTWPVEVLAPTGSPLIYGLTVLTQQF